jgi:hypothetical protein
MKTDTCEGRPDHCSVSALTVCQAFNRVTIATAMYREVVQKVLAIWTLYL